MEQPFTSRQIRRFLLLYASIVATLILFFLLNRAFNPVEMQKLKVFNTAPAEQSKLQKNEEKKSKEPSPFKLLPKQY